MLRRDVLLVRRERNSRLVAEQIRRHLMLILAEHAPRSGDCYPLAEVADAAWERP